MSQINSNTNTQTKSNSNLFKALLRQGISRSDAEYLDQAFSGPSVSSTSFVEGMETIAKILALKDPMKNFKSKDTPLVEPWKSIFGEMSQSVIQNNENPDNAFSVCLRKFNQDKDLQLAITNAISHRMGVIQKIEQEKGRNKQLLTKDYKDALIDLGYSFKMKELDNSIEINEKPLTDPKVSEILNAMTDRGFKVSKTLTVIDEIAFHNKFHPIKDYLDSLTWDGKNHIEKLTSYFNDQYGMFSTWLRKWLIGSCAKVFEAEQNPMLVMDGPQGVGKSEFARWLASPMMDYFIEAPINTDDKDCEIRLISYWIWEVSELGVTTRKADYEALKAFLTTRKVTVRKPYGKQDISKPALASFIGTINNSSGIFSDPTGSRRFMTSKLIDIVWDYSKDIDSNDIWAEALAAYKDGEDWKLTPDEMKKSNEINIEYDVPDPIEGLLKKFFDLDPIRDDWWIPTSDIVEVLKDSLKGNLRGSDKSIQMDLGKTMTKLGHESKRDYNRNNQRVNGYTGIKLSSNSPFTMNP